MAKNVKIEIVTVGDFPVEIMSAFYGLFNEFSNSYAGDNRLKDVDATFRLTLSRAGSSFTVEGSVKQ